MSLAPTVLDSVVGLLEARVERAINEGARVVSATIEVDPSVDPCAVVFGSRLASDSWFCWEQPERGGFALATLGAAHQIAARGERRFAEVAADLTDLMRGAAMDDVAGLPPGAGPVFTGGFAFADEGGGAPWWSSLPPALMVLPELALVRQDGGVFLTVNVAAREDAAERVRARLASLSRRELPLLDPAPTGQYEIGSPRAPGAFEESVARATARIRAGELEKVVLAREVTVEAPAAYDPAMVFGAIRGLFPSCFCFCVGTPEAAFVGASPELLVRRRGASAATVALAGSTRRSADPAVDDHLGEQLLRSPKDREEHQIVVRRIERSLRPHSVWVTAAPQPELIKVANIQHLATPIRAHLSDPRSALELAGLLHPTPAVGGEPWPAAERAIGELEGMDRGWYAGPVGWMDSTEDGEFCVGLRSALLRDRTARLFAGNGMVADSDPQAELAETEVKLQALLPLLTG
jgi:isochorismate synthase